MSIQKTDPLNEERRVIDNLIAGSQSLLGSNETLQQYPPSSEYPMEPAKTKMMIKSRRGRTSYTQAQLSDLEAAFSNTHYPDFQTRKELSNCLKIPDDRIQVWFQNRRAKFRKTQRQVFNSYQGTATTQNAPTMMLVHSNQGQNSRQPVVDNAMRRPSPIQHTTSTIKEERTEFNGTCTASNSTCTSAPGNNPQKQITKQEELVNIYEKLTTPHTSQELVSENQKIAPSLYSLSATISSSGQYIILGGDNMNPNVHSNFQRHVSSTNTSGKY